MGFIPDTSSYSGSSSLRGLNDCKVVSPSSGLVLFYNWNQWQNQNIDSSLSTLSDVSIQQQSLANGEVLTVNNVYGLMLHKRQQRIHFLNFRRLVKKVMLRDIVV